MLNESVQYTALAEFSHTPQNFEALERGDPVLDQTWEWSHSKDNLKYNLLCSFH